MPAPRDHALGRFRLVDPVYAADSEVSGVLPLLQRRGGRVSERLELGVGLDAPARARRWIVGVCESRDLSHLSDEAALLVDELVTNAVVHARTDCVVVADKVEDVLQVEVMDSNGDSAAVEPGAERLSAEGGRGLVIVEALAAAWGVNWHPDGKAVWFTLRGALSEGAAHNTAATWGTARS